MLWLFLSCDKKYKKQQHQPTNAKPSCDESKISVSHAGLGAILLDRSRTNSHSQMVYWFWKTSLWWHQQAAWCKRSQAVEQSNSCWGFSICIMDDYLLQAKPSLVQGVMHPQATAANKISSENWFWGFVSFKRNLLCTLWLLWGVNRSPVSGDGSGVVWPIRPVQVSAALWLWS